MTATRAIRAPLQAGHAADACFVRDRRHSTPTTCGDCHTTDSWGNALSGPHPLPNTFTYTDASGVVKNDTFLLANSPHAGIKCLSCHQLSLLATTDPPRVATTQRVRVVISRRTSTRRIARPFARSPASRTPIPATRRKTRRSAGPVTPKDSRSGTAPRTRSSCRTAARDRRAAWTVTTRLRRRATRMVQTCAARSRVITAAVQAIATVETLDTNRIASTAAVIPTRASTTVKRTVPPRPAHEHDLPRLARSHRRAGIPYILWTRLEARKHVRAAEIHDDVMSLGDDVVPASIHSEDRSRSVHRLAALRARVSRGRHPRHHRRPRAPDQPAVVHRPFRVHAGVPGRRDQARVRHGDARHRAAAADADFETNQPGIYIVGELGGMGLIRNAVEQGRQAAERSRAASGAVPRGDLDLDRRRRGPRGHLLRADGDGARPQGADRRAGSVRRHDHALSASEDRDDRLVRAAGLRHRAPQDDEQGAAARAVDRHPRAHAARPSREGVRVEDDQARGQRRWRVFGSDGLDRAASVVLALGRRGAPQQLGVPGEDLDRRSPTGCSSPSRSRGKHVMVVGGGNAAADCAIALADAKLCASVSISYRRAELPRLRNSVRSRLERAASTPSGSQRCSRHAGRLDRRRSTSR